MKARLGNIARNVAPWIVSIVVCAALLAPFRGPEGRAALAQSMREASPWTIPAIVIFAIGTWLTDTWATAMTFRRFGTVMPMGEACLVRGTVFMFDAVNASLGQAALAVAMHRRGVPVARNVQIMLLLNVVFTLELVVMAGLGLLVGAHEAGLSTTLVVGSVAAAVLYLALIMTRPAWLAKRNAFRQLFEVGVQGHVHAFVVRAPNMVWLFIGQLITLQCFGIGVPLGTLLVAVPAIIIVTGLPISVQGVGPAQAAQVTLLAPFVVGRNAEAAILAWGLTTSLVSAVSWFLIGVTCLLTKTGRATFAAGREGAPTT